MNIIGIIAEYNPFHNGHKRMIQKIKEMYTDSLIIVILNGNYTQRGEISIINKWDKTKILLNNEVDLIIELPSFYGINNADTFSYGALKILNDLKVDTIIFGSESNDINNLIHIAKEKINNTKYNTLLKQYLDEGYSYPKSSSLALQELTSTNITTPNDILALSYIEQIIKNNYNITPISIKRENNYHETTLCESASSIRNAYKNNIDISKYIPNNTTRYYNNIDEKLLFNLTKYKILSTDDLNIFHDVKEGIDKRIKKYIIESNTLEELILKVKTKRYTYNRIKRILLYILLDIKKEDINNYKLYIRPLGFNDKGIKYLNKIKKELTLPLINNYSKNKDILSLEYKINSIHSLLINNNNYINDEFNKPSII